MRLAEHLVRPHHAYAGGLMQLTARIARTRIFHSR